MPTTIAIPSVLQTVRPKHLTCLDCGEFLENAVNFSTCPHMHGKLRPWLDRDALNEICDLRLLEGVRRRFDELPTAQRSGAKRKSYHLSDRGCELFRRRRLPLTRELILRAARGRGLIAFCEDADEGIAVFTRLNRKKFDALRKDAK